MITNPWGGGVGREEGIVQYKFHIFTLGIYNIIVSVTEPPACFVIGILIVLDVINTVSSVYTVATTGHVGRSAAAATATLLLVARVLFPVVAGTPKTTTPPLDLRRRSKRN